MKFHIPFTFLSIDILKSKSKALAAKIRYKKSSKLYENLKNAGVDITREEYLGIIFRSFIISLIALLLVLVPLFGLLGMNKFYLWAPILALMFSLFILFSQSVYPKIYVARRQRDIEKNLLPAMEDILVQLNSGVPLFSVLVNISAADYGELSIEFKKAVKKINAGSPEQEVLEDISKSNPSIFFKRALWQISNGMKAGSDMVIVVKDSLQALNEEQLIQIQNYGNKLNPLIVFYMLVAVIIPALSVTFLTIISSMVNLPKNTSMILFFGLFIVVMFVQIMFLGIIKSRRPSLL